MAQFVHNSIDPAIGLDSRINQSIEIAIVED
jgi:hypothetical protein